MNKNIFLAIILSTIGVLLAQPTEWTDNPGGYEFTSWIVGGIVLYDGVQLGEDGDQLAAFGLDGTVRGVGVQLVPDFGPYNGVILYEMTMGSNANGDILSFQYYDASADEVLEISESYVFETNAQLGDLMVPFELNA